MSNYQFSTNTSSSLYRTMGSLIDDIDMTTGTTVLIGGSQNNSTSAMQSIGFDFWIMGVRQTQFNVTSNGWVGIGTMAAASYGFGSPWAGVRLAPMLGVAGPSGGIGTSSIGRVHYKVVGSQTNRVLVVEFLRMAINTTVVNDTNTFQVRLYESTGTIEYVYGRMIATLTLPKNYNVGFQFSPTLYNNLDVTTNTISTSSTTPFSVGVSGPIANIHTPTAGNNRAYVWTPDPPDDPGVITINNITSSSMRLNWINPSNESGFALYRSTNGGLTYQYEITLPPNLTTYTVTGLTSSTQYSWRLFSYRESISAPADGVATTLPANKIYTINSGNWNDPSIWNTSTVPTSQDSAEVSVGHSVIFNAATGACGTLLVKGTLAYWTSNANQYFVVNGDVIVYPTGNFNAGSGTGPAANPFYLYIGGSALTSTAAGNLIVDGTFDMQTTASVQVLFYGTQNATVTGSGATCDIPFIYVNKGSLNNQIEFLRTFTQPSSLSSYTSVQRMIVNSGTMKLSAPIVVNSFHTSMVYFVNNNNSRFWLNHTGINLSPVPLVTGIATLGLFGELRIDAGKINLGTGANSNYITTNGVLKLNGGECNLKGNFTIFGIASAQLLVYGGKLSIDPQGLNNLSNNVSIFSVNTSSTFEFTDGLIEIVNPHSTAPLTSTIASINIQSGGYRNISGGAFAIGDGVSIKSGGVLSSSCGFNIISAVPLHKLIIRNNYSSSNSRYCRISSNLIIEDSLILETGSYLQTGSAGVGRKVIVEGHIKNNGIISAVYPTSTGPGVGSIELEGTSPRVVSGAGTASWLSLRVANTGGVTFSNTGTWELERIVMEKGNVTNALSAISIGSALYRANITIGGLDETTTAGTFSNLPTIISVAGNPNYIYGPAANSMQTGSFNEISAGAATLNCLTINDAQGLVSNRNINIEDSLNLIKGVLNIGNNSLVLGTSVSSTGRLTRTSGFVQLGNNGSFTRWYASGARPQFEYSTGFPLSIGSRDRSVLFSLNTGIATGGSIMVTHNNIVGYTDITPAFSDGGITINRRVNSFWKLSSPTAVNIGAGRILTLRLIGEGTGSVLDPTKLQVVKSNSIAMGTAVASGGTNIVPYVNRDFTQAQIALGGLYDTLYIGANSSVNPLLPNIIAINTGNWNVPSTWEGNVIPTMSNSATIDNGVVVTIPTGYTATCNGLNIVAGGELAAVSGSLNNAARLTIDGTLNVSGSTINVTASTGHGILINSGGLLTSSGGIVNIGPSGGGDRELLVQGTLTVTGGNININGNLNIASTGTLNQSGGNINVDVNSGTASTSLAAGTHMVSINSNNLNCSNGSINIIDPPHSSVLPGTMMALRITAPSSLTAFTADHSFVFGNGTSTEVGNSNGFVIDVRRSGLVPIQNVIVNAGNANGRWVSTSYTNGTYGTYIKGNLTINSGSEFRHTNTSTFVVGKNLINNGTLTVSAPMVFGGNGYYVINNAQTISGTGVFRNSVSSPTASFGSATVDNGVSLSLGSSNKTFSFSGVLNIGSIKVYTGNNTLAFTNSGTLSRTTGYVVGNLSKYFAVGSSVSKTYEIGDTNNYLPVTITYPSVTTAGNVIVSTINGDHPLLSSSCFDSNKTINRYWNITNSGTVNTGGNYTFSFNASDVDFGTNLSSSKLFVYSPSSWKAGLSGTSSPTTFSVNGLTEYGDVAIGEIIPATASITISVSDTAVCSGTSLTFNSSITNGGDAPTYQWKVNGTNVGTGSSYSSFSLNNGDTVTCTLTSNNACVSSPIVVSNSIVTKIYQPSVGGTISGDTAICSGNSPSALTLSGNTGSVVRWESSVSPFLVYSPIINTTTTLNPGTLTQTTKYRAVVQNGVCSSVNSAIHTINVNPTPVAGTITGTNAVCSGNSPGVLTLGGTTGTIQKWQSKTTG
ncbi:MAG: fibronectin type III domain-containing protein, partial [Bacteroidia bacterium]|nr:fibronectin type III domain-containing protein [Bacteroidia bacterium]